MKWAHIAYLQAQKYTPLNNSCPVALWALYTGDHSQIIHTILLCNRCDNWEQISELLIMTATQDFSSTLSFTLHFTKIHS